MVGKMVWKLDSESEIITKKAQTGYKKKSIISFQTRFP